MTPEQLDHLQLLKTHLTNLLETAKKRTPGEWKVCNGKHGAIIRLTKDTVGEPTDVCRAWNCSRKDGNATFIASCAGNAEAGWRSTKFAIAGLQSVINMTEDPSIRLCAEAGIKTILAEWPLELITKH